VRVRERSSGTRPLGSRLFILARHAESEANLARVVSSNPDRPIALTATGELQARHLGIQLAGIPIDLAVVTRFARTQQTARLALDARDVPLMIEPGLDEIDSGSCDGAPIESYWAWGSRHNPDEPFPQGETLNEALLRYAASLRRLLLRAEPVTLIVAHEFAIGRILQAAARLPSPPQQGFANAVPYFLDQHAVTEAADGLETTAHQPREPPPS
jgi:broad specificity phosphatase PhoE